VPVPPVAQTLYKGAQGPLRFLLFFGQFFLRFSQLCQFGIRAPLSLSEFCDFGLVFDQYVHALLQKFRDCVHPPVQPFFHRGDPRVRPLYARFPLLHMCVGPIRALLPLLHSDFSFGLRFQNELDGPLNIHGARIPRRNDDLMQLLPIEI